MHLGDRLQGTGAGATAVSRRDSGPETPLPLPATPATDSAQPRACALVLGAAGRVQRRRRLRPRLHSESWPRVVGASHTEPGCLLATSAESQGEHKNTRYRQD
eukprot:278607-Chlamydomonas_euryale.AAC.2